MNTMDLNHGQTTIGTDILENLRDKVCHTMTTHGPSIDYEPCRGCLLSSQPPLSLTCCSLSLSLLPSFHISFLNNSISEPLVGAMEGRPLYGIMVAARERKVPHKAVSQWTWDDEIINIYIEPNGAKCLSAGKGSHVYGKGKTVINPVVWMGNCGISIRALYSLSVVAVTKYHDLSGFEKNTDLLLDIWVKLKALAG